MPPTDVLHNSIENMTARRDELAPAVVEHHELNEALEKLGVSVNETPAPRTKAAKKNGAKRNGSRRGRPPGSGKTTAKLLATIEAEPGLTIPELASRLKLKSPNYLYRATKQLVEQGKVYESGDKRWYPSAVVPVDVPDPAAATGDPAQWAAAQAAS